MEQQKPYFVDLPQAKYAGTHILIDMWVVWEDTLRDGAEIERVLVEAAKVAGATVLHTHFHHFGGEYGVTGVVVLAESHISIHTWPEHKHASIDLFMCGECDPNKSVPMIVDHFKPHKCNITELLRGITRIS